MKRVLFQLFLPIAAHTQTIPAIQLNQVGFYPNAPKLAVVTGDVNPSPFYVLGQGKKDTVYMGTLGTEKRSAFSSIKTRLADFSPLRKEGVYILIVPGIGTSHPFKIRNGVHRSVGVSVLKGFYFIRSDYPLEEKYAGRWARMAGHPDTAVEVHPSAASGDRPAGTLIATPGGWYDAGDYNKYIVNSGITMGTLLSAYEDFSSYYSKLNIQIPESSDKVPDIVNEILYNLRWMLSMQDPNDGGVYHKCTNARFDGMVMPGATKLPRYVVQKSTAASLNFAAVTAQAARILKRYAAALPGLADSCLAASFKAWNWAIAHPKLIYSQQEINQKFDPDITTGEYGDRNLDDEWLWAACELFATTKKNSYFDIIRNYKKLPASVPTWSNVTLLGYYTLIRTKMVLPPKVRMIVKDMQDSLLQLASRFISKSGSSAFATVMGQSARDFIWGSNSVAANQGILLIRAYEISGNKKFLDGALTNLDYLLGRNATGYCFVTGSGSRSPMHPHHRPSEADGIDEPVPGLLAGGPNPGKQDKCDYPFTEPETAFVDNVCSYASNEIAINWNAPLVYLVNAIEVLYQK